VGPRPVRVDDLVTRHEPPVTGAADPGTTAEGPASQAGDGPVRSATEAASPPPVLVLGSHRSGTSALAGLLVRAAGLRIGEPLPPTAANPKGYFESAVVVKAHNDALARLDRDWTCPPVTMAPDAEAAALIAAEVATLSAEPGAWGVKDPRLLFTLPLWCDVLDEFRLVGVVRDHEQVARSLVSRDRVRPWMADQVTRAHLRRLRLLREELEFPVVDFTEPATFVDAARRTARALDLDWDEEAATEFHDAGLRSDHGTGHHANDDVDHLLGLPPVEVAPTFTAAQVSAALARVAERELAEESPVTLLSLHAGPQAARRRRILWSRVPNGLRDRTVELVTDERLATRGRPGPDDATVFEVRSMDDLLVALAEVPDDTTALVAADVTSWLPPNQLAAFVGVVAEGLPAGAVVVLGCSDADRITVTGRGRTPIEFEALVAALGDDFRVVDEGRRATVSWVRAKLRDVPRVPRPPVPIPDSEWEVDWQARYEELRSSRLVGAALAVADVAGPVVRTARRGRAAIRSWRRD
jgi:hypothetical protein